MFDLLAGSPDTDLSSAALLARAREEQEAARRAEARVLVLAHEWAVAHPVPPGGRAALIDCGAGFEPEPIAGQGADEVAEFCVAEFGAALGMSTASARRLLGHAVELQQRLPRLWARVVSGEVPAWRARGVAEATIHATPRLSREAAAWVDAQIAPFAGKVGPAQLDRTVAEAIKRHQLADPQPLDEDELDPANFADPEADPAHDPRCVRVDTDALHFQGTMEVSAVLRLADALDLDNAVRAGAAELRALGSTDSLDARRATALGMLARQQTSLALAPADPSPSARRPTAPARRLDLHLHFAAQLSGGSSGLDVDPVGRLDEGQRLVLLDQVRSWLGDSLTEVRVLPVIDLASERSTHSYTPSATIRRQVELRDKTCVFPWCSRPAPSCDLDHVIPFDHAAVDEGRPQSGPTSTHNLAPLCRHHHRLKTLTPWRYEADPESPPGSGRYLWTSPHDLRFLRDLDGTQVHQPYAHAP